MEFRAIRDKDVGLLNPKELKDLNELIDRGVALLTDLKKESTFERLKKLVMKYARAVNAKTGMLESVIERTLKVSPSLSIHVNDIITNTQDLILIVKQAKVINRYLGSLINRLAKMLAKYKVFVKLDVSVNFWNAKTRAEHRKITLGFKDLSVATLVQLLLGLYEHKIKNNFLRTEAGVIDSGIILDFITGINKEELKLAINEDPEHAEFLMKAYVVLNHQVKQINSLVELMNKGCTVDNESVLESNTALLRSELKKVGVEFVQAMNVMKEARHKKVITERLVSIYNETELIRDAEVMIKSYLRYKFNINDLLEQLAYEYLVVYDAVPDKLSEYGVFKKQSKYQFLKTFFSR